MVHQITERSISIDRPDIVKKQQGSANLTFKEIKDALFKFLMQAGVRFIGFEKLNLPIEVKSKVDDNSFILNNTHYYTVTCRLLDIKVDGFPIYIVAVPGTELELDKRHYGKLLYLKKIYKIVVFNEEDCKSVGIDISNKAWIGSLNKNIMKKWAKLLFKKISLLGSNIESKYSLNDLYRQIESGSNKTGINVAKMTVFKQESLKLKQLIIKNKLEYLLPNLKTYPEEALNHLSRLNKESAIWIESVLNEIIYNILKRIDLRKNQYKDFFRQKNGKITVVNRERLTQLISKELEKVFKIDITNLGYGALRLQNKLTFQTISIVCEPTHSEETRGIELNQELIKTIKDDSLYYLNLRFDKESGKLIRSKVYLFILDKNTNDYKNNKLQVFDSKTLDCCKIYLVE